MIFLNGEEYQFKGNLMDLLKIIGLSKDTVAILVNSEIIKKEDYNFYYVKEGDYVEVISFVGGG
ncbi:sulfur carrier protein ThiS [Caldicellulosiruptoraceae bacterium PP1]